MSVLGLFLRTMGMVLMPVRHMALSATVPFSLASAADEKVAAVIPFLAIGAATDF